MAHGALTVVEQWQNAVNARDSHRLRELSAPDVDVTGPRGSASGRDVLAEWMRRAGLSFRPLRWFCDAAGTVVVEQDARWSDPQTGRELDAAVVASEFHVEGGVVTRYTRHEDLATALEAASMTTSAEVTGRA